MTKRQKSAESSRSSAPWSTSSSRRDTFPRSTTPSGSSTTARPASSHRRRRRGRAAHRREQVRCIAMKPTDGMVRGMKAIDTGGPITVPVGRETLGRILNVLGEPVDERGPVNAEERWSIHREPPPSRTSRRRSRCSRPASRSSTCSSRTRRAARPASSAAPASARPSHPGADQQRRQAARRLLGVRRRGRAHPRRQRPLARVRRRRASSTTGRSRRSRRPRSSTAR